MIDDSSMATRMTKRVRVLVVDDDDSIRTLVARVFERRGYEVETASDGAQAIEVLGNAVFDLLVLDLMMPRVDGISVLKHLDAMTGTPPAVIVMTAAVPAIIGRLPEPYGGKVLTKPFDLEQLLRDADQALGLAAEVRE